MNMKTNLAVALLAALAIFAGAALANPPPPPPAVDVEALVRDIDNAVTLEFLELLRPQMRQVPKGPDRDRVVAAVQRRAEEIRAEQAPTPEAKGGALSAPPANPPTST